MATQSGNRGQYSIIELPHSGRMLDQCTTRYRDFRLHVLKNARDQIAGSYEIESKLPLSHFRKLLARKDRHVVVAVLLLSEAQRQDDNEALAHGEWVGCQHLIGPMPLSNYSWPNIGGLKSDDEETRWHVFGLYILPGHRGPQRLTMRMRPVVDGLVNRETRKSLGPRARRDGRQWVNVRWRCGVTGANRGILNFYESIGWKVAGYVPHEVHHRASENGYEDCDSEQRQHSQEDVVVDCTVLERVTWVEVGDREMHNAEHHARL